MSQKIFDDFHIAFFDKVKMSYWIGQPCQKYPIDLFNYQELIVETQPDIIIECGTNQGGTAFFLSSILSLMGKTNGKVLTCDVQDIRTQKVKELGDKIIFYHGSSISEDIVTKIKSHIKERDRVMVVLDSDHRCYHVLEEMKIYGELVTKDCYMIVEDSDLNGHPIYPSYGAGPFEAIEIYMREHNNGKFINDKIRENMYLITNAVNGYLKKVL